jgi:hypothetical protein
MTDQILAEGTSPQTTVNRASDVSSIPDPFDPDSLRLSQGFTAMTDVKQVLLTVPVRKPSPQDFVRTRPEEEWQLTTAVIYQNEEREFYIVDRDLRLALLGEIRPVRLVTAMNRQQVVFLWPLWLPDATGRTNRWHESALEAAKHSETKWTRLCADMSLGAYRVYQAQGQLPEPQWPVETLRDLLAIAFKDRRIDSLDHPVLKRLRGEI